MPLTGGNEIKAARSIGWESESTWRRFCGFLDFSQDAALDVQRRLLAEQNRLLEGRPLGQRVTVAMEGDERRGVRRGGPRAH